MPLKQILFFSVLFSMLASFACANNAVDAENKNRYRNYTFEPVLGKKEKLTSGTMEDQVRYNYLQEWNSLDQLFSLEFENHYVSYVSVTLNDIRKYIQFKDAQSKKGIPVESGEWQAVVVQDLKKTKLSMPIKSGKLIPQGRAIADFYGCLEEAPLFKMNIMGSKYPELFVITGGGEHTANMNGGGAFDFLRLSAFSLTNESELFNVDLMAVNYKTSAGTSSILSVSKSDYDKISIIKSAKGEGRKKFAKLFFKDFNKNGYMNILIWSREYSGFSIDRSLQQNEEKFKLSLNKYIVLEEDPTGTAFNKVNVADTVIKQWMGEFDLTWVNGWPSQENGNQCKGAKKKFPMNWISDPILNGKKFKEK